MSNQELYTHIRTSLNIFFDSQPALSPLQYQQNVFFVMYDTNMDCVK